MIDPNYLMDLKYIANVQDYFQYITKKYETVTDNHPTKIYVNKTEK